jgi:hypothetical protein
VRQAGVALQRDHPPARLGSQRLGAHVGQGQIAGLRLEEVVNRYIVDQAEVVVRDPVGVGRQIVADAPFAPGHELLRVRVALPFPEVVDGARGTKVDVDFWSTGKPEEIGDHRPHELYRADKRLSLRLREASVSPIRQEIVAHHFGSVGENVDELIDLFIRQIGANAQPDQVPQEQLERWFGLVGYN